MKHIKRILKEIRDKPVCPETGEINLYWLIQKHINHDTETRERQPYAGNNIVERYGT